uniref:GDP-fucose protein O-fucosyltransferase 1-like n=1 Tax=Styela clava TaxID=7725 RepID=UPI00193984FF|nr:GDP-fucose protein O-fucosyltransferase 1-like [Styela clava]
MSYKYILLFFVAYASLKYVSASYTWDPSGYVMYCPCMGRLGNQMEQFLGSLRFSKNLNRTMIVPPWIAYDSRADTSFTPYDKWFDFDELQKFHRVIPMETFMNEFASKHWPDDGKSRVIFCPKMAIERSPDSKSCPAKIGNPFGPFWDSFHIDFTGGSEVYSHGILSISSSKGWNKEYPPERYPVLALMGAPGAFPIAESDRGLQKYVKWSETMINLAEDFIDKHLKRPYIGIHLRNGIDWKRACSHVKDITHHFMGSPQCCGYNKQHQLTDEMCFPSKDSIVNKVKQIAKLHGATHIFIATDEDPMIKELSETGLQLVKYDENYPIADLAILTMADAFIGNCVSTFTSFVVRDREVKDMPNYFFSFDHQHAKIIHDDL